MNTKPSKYYPPAYRNRAFHCPHCGVYAAQHWATLKFKMKEFLIDTGTDARIGNNKAWYSVCEHCNHPALWSDSILVYPSSGGFPLPNEDLPDEVMAIYREAGSVAQLSPRAACALLRLALQMLLKKIGESGDINKAIESLDRNGLDPEIKRALHTVRVIGNHAIHPGRIDFEENTDTNGLFELLNAIVRDRITLPRERLEIFNRLPKEEREFIAKQDRKSIEKNG